jgi:hypothetical protein
LDQFLDQSASEARKRVYLSRHLAAGLSARRLVLATFSESWT